MALKTMPTSMTISAKCSDLFSATLHDDQGNEVSEYIGYVPDFFPDEHFGDYVMLDIDLKTGQIMNWKAPSLKDINDMLKKSS